MPGTDRSKQTGTGKLESTDCEGQEPVEFSKRPNGKKIEQARYMSVRASTSADRDLYVDVMVGDHPVRMLVDCGASVSVINTGVASSIGCDKFLKRDMGVKMTTAGEHSIPFKGKGELNIGLGGKSRRKLIWFADVSEDGILGLDCLEDWKCKVDFGLREMWVDGVKIQCHSLDVSPTCCRVTLSDTVILPPFSGQVVQGLMQDDLTNIDVILEPSARWSGPGKVLVDAAVMRPSAKTIPVRVINVSNQPVKFYKGTTVGQCESAEVLQQKTGATDEPSQIDKTLYATIDGMQVPEHLQDIWKQSAQHLNKDERVKLSNLLCTHSDVFSKSKEDLGRTDVVRHQIDTGTFPPIRQRARRLPVHQRQEESSQIEDMTRRGVIEASESPWASPIVLVKKKDGSTRFCIDFRKLNDVTTKDAFPLPRIDDSLDRLSGSQWFSTLDLQSGYWQVEMSEKDRGKTAFITAYGLYQFRVMPFGLCNAPATFERLMTKVLDELIDNICLVYLDDVIVHSSSVLEQLTRLDTILGRLKKFGLKLNPKKCVLLQKEVSFLGHVVSAEGVSADPQKISSVNEWPTPRTVHDVRCFLGLCSYYRKFVKGFGDIASPLHQLTEKGRIFHWTEECEDAFRRLKHELTTSPVLAYPTADDPFILDTDASANGLGAVLTQVQRGTERVIAYYSKSMTKVEKRYCVTRKELLAVVSGVRQFHHYLYGQKFTVRSDHGALRWLINFRNPVGQVARWLEILGTYDLDIQHRAGRVHGNADALSRRPCQDCSHCQRLEENDTADTPITKEVSSVGTNTEDSCSEMGKIRVATIRTQEAEHQPNENIGAESIVEEDPLWTKSYLRDVQGQDPELAQVLQWKMEGRRPSWQEVAPLSPKVKSLWSQWERLELQEGVLYRRWESLNGKEISLQLVLPAVLRKKVFAECHDSKVTGHMGRKRTIERIRRRCYWPQLQIDVELWCKLCRVCESRKNPSRRPRAPLQVYNVGAPMERVAMDIMGPLPQSDRGNKYVLVISDYFTKWTESYAIPNQEAATVARVFVEEFVCRYGVPLEVHTDQGRNFESALFQSVCKILGCSKTRTTAFHPQSDGMVERFNRTLEDLMAKTVADHQKDWDDCLPLVMMAYRSSQHEATGYAPSELMMGRQMILPVDLLMGCSGTPQSSYPEFTEKLQDRMAYTHELARKRLKVKTDRNKRAYDTRKAGEGHTLGDAVWLHTKKRKKGISPKLQRSWTGPFYVLDVLSDVTYRIQETPKTKPKVVHFNRLKTYVGADMPDWVQKKTECKDNSASSPNSNVFQENEMQTTQEAVSQEERTPEDGNTGDIPIEVHESNGETITDKKRLYSDVAATSKPEAVGLSSLDQGQAKQQRTSSEMLPRRSQRLRKPPSHLY